MIRTQLSNPRNGARVFEMATLEKYGGRMEGADELPYEELFLAKEKKPFYKRIAKYIAPPLVGMTMLAGCATERYYEKVESLPDEVDVLNIDSRPQGAEVIYEGKAIGKTPMQVEVRFKWQKRTELEGTERGGKIRDELIRDTWTKTEPLDHKFKIYAQGYFEGEIIHRTDGKSNSKNYCEILREDWNKPVMHQEQTVIIKQDGKIDKLGIK